MNAQTTTPATAAEKRLLTQRIYIKGSTFDSPETPEIFKATIEPKIDMQAQTNYKELEPKIYEAVLTIKLIAKHEEKVVWTIELHQAGIFTIEGIAGEELKQVLNGHCMNIVYPYACEAISGIVVRSGFPPIYLTPINFEVLHFEQQKRQKEKASVEQIVV